MTPRIGTAQGQEGQEGQEKGTFHKTPPTRARREVLETRVLLSLNAPPVPNDFHPPATRAWAGIRARSRWERSADRPADAERERQS